MSSLRFRAILAIFMAVFLLLFVCPQFVSADLNNWQAQPFHHLRIDASAFAVSGLSPANVKVAYNLPATGGQGTIAIIDAYDNPNVASDLKTFSSQFGLPAATLEVHKMSNTVRGNVNWGLEIALDVQWAHAIAPNAKILLVEAKSNSFTDLLSAINYASGRSDVVAVSMSWGGSEFSGETAYDSYFTSQYGAVFYASSGDNGAGTSWPAVSAKVISVGGTTLTFSNDVVSSETVWSGSGGGVSTYVPVPTYQAGLEYSNRATPDVSYDADPNSGFAVYDSYGYGWLVVGGTSAGAPQWAAIQALGSSATTTNIYNAYAQPQLYAADFRDITTGSNGYNAVTGYDLATGIGSPLTTNFAAAPLPDFALSVSPNTLTTNAGTKATVTASVTALNGFAAQVTLTATAPPSWTTTLTPASLAGAGVSTLAVTPPAGTATGTYTVTVKGQSTDLNGNPLIHTSSVTVKVTNPDYTLTANPTSLSIRQGSSGTSKIALNALNGYAGTVTLSAKATTSRVTLSLNPNAITVGQSSTLTVKVPSSATRGTYTITVTGVDVSGLSHQVTINLVITR